MQIAACEENFPEMFCGKLLHVKTKSLLVKFFMAIPLCDLLHSMHEFDLEILFVVYRKTFQSPVIDFIQKSFYIQSEKYYAKRVMIFML